MKIILSATLAAAAIAASVGASLAMPIAPSAAPSLVQEVRDPTCKQVKGRCQWYGMPGVHHGPQWLRQHGGEGHMAYHKSKHRLPLHHDSM